jgi:hypothetical protein
MLCVQVGAGLVGSCLGSGMRTESTLCFRPHTESLWCVLVLCCAVLCAVQAGAGLVGSCLGSGSGAARRFQFALEDSIATHFPGNHAINCMCHSSENFYRCVGVVCVGGVQAVRPGRGVLGCDEKSGAGGGSRWRFSLLPFVQRRKFGVRGRVLTMAWIGGQPLVGKLAVPIQGAWLL